MDGVRAIFDRVADDYGRYEDSRVHRRLSAALNAVIEKNLPPGSSILDLGSGPGTYAVPFAEAGYRVTAVDIAPRMLARLEQLARERGVQVATRCLDASRELGALEVHDAAISVHGPLNYAGDPLPIVEHIASRVRPGGLLLFAFARAASLEQIARRPLLALRPLWQREPYAARGHLGGGELTVHIHDPSRLAERLARVIELIDRRAIGVSTTLPAPLDEALGRRPLLRRIGASSLFIGRVRSR